MTDNSKPATDQTGTPLDREDVIACLRVLERLRDDPTLASGSDGLMPLVAQVYKRERRERRRAEGSARKSRDREMARDAARQLQDARKDSDNDVVETELDGGPSVALEFGTRSCYGCRVRFREFHARYPWFCPDCAAQNLQKRGRRIDLAGRVVLVTGGRVKIGFHTALLALRGGATVHVTSRFPKDTLRRFARETDFADWGERFFIHGMDFRDLRGLLVWCDALSSRMPVLDVLVNNAAQSVKRSEAWHEKHRAFERETRLEESLADRICTPPDSEPKQLTGPAEMAEATRLAELVRSELCDPNDRDDLRESNSWTMKLGEVSPVEFLEVLLVNANAPALLVSRLRPLLAASPHARRFIVNATGTDGLLSLEKSGNHPHVNMSKAALNMVTRSCGKELAGQGIFMNSVDTGWVTHEGGFTARRRGEESPFVPPLDAVDAAARILDPVVEGISGKSQPRSGCLFRNFAVAEW